jgi:hypothetical protein
MYDVNQRSVSDCYYLATIQSMAITTPTKLRALAVDLGDGTYAVQFDRNGVKTDVRVNAVFSSAAAVMGASGDIWALVMEKAYAYFRTGADTYASLNNGDSGAVMGDFGLIYNSLTPASSSATTVYNLIKSELSAGEIVTASTGSSPPALIGSHSYSVVSVSTDANNVMWVTLRNPWGFDGTGSDSNPNDGLVTITMAVYQANVSWMDYVV